MSNETEFFQGLIVKAPNENAPEYVKGKLSFKLAEVIPYLQSIMDSGEEWANAEVLVSQGGKWYAKRDTWKPQQGGGSGGGSSARQPARVERKDAPPANNFADDFADDDIPFATNRSVW